MARHVKKGDTVEIKTGVNKGATGKVMRVIPGKDRILVEGVNLAYKHVRPSQKNPQGGIIEKESSIHISNVMVIDPKTNEPTRVGYKFLEDGTKVRISKKSGEMLRS